MLSGNRSQRENGRALFTVDESAGCGFYSGQNLLGMIKSQDNADFRYTDPSILPICVALSLRNLGIKLMKKL